MKAQRIDGKAISDQIKEEAALEAQELQRQGIPPALLWFWWATIPLPWYM